MRISLVALILLGSVIVFGTAGAQSILVDRSAEPTEKVLSIPFAFYNEHFGVAGGWAHGFVGRPQPQSMLLGAAMVGSQGSGMVTVIGQNLQIPGNERMFLDPVIQIGYFSDAEAYIDGNPQFAGQRSGSNSSDEDNFVEGDGFDNFFRLNFKYVLPIGTGRDEIITTYKVDRGMLREPRPTQSHWNLFSSGKSYIEFRPFYRSQNVDGDDVDEDLNTNGMDLAFFWDNRDFPLNPSSGHSIRIKGSRDFGVLESDNSWTVVQAEIDKYFNLGTSDRIRQNVLAFDIWTAYTPSWDVAPNGDIDNRPPAYAGATLGGIWRLRAYPAQRFSDKAAINYSVEYRLIPNWNPFNKWPALQKHIGVQWLQFVAFGEAGRVAPSWDMSELHEDMKWDVGLGVRAFAKGIVVRVDTAFSEEGAGVQMMVGQSFQF